MLISSTDCLGTFHSPLRPPATASLSADFTPVFIDVETRSDCNLQEFGGRRYAVDSSTKLLSVTALIETEVFVWATEGPPHVDAAALRSAWMPERFSVRYYGGDALPPPLVEAVRLGRTFCAHNAEGFERHVWSVQGFPEPVAWLDTIPMARAAGLPGSLDKASRRIFGIGKDSAGDRLLKELTSRLPTDDEWTVLLRYNVQDVLLLAGLHRVLPPIAEEEVLNAHRKVNDRGVAFDGDLARRLMVLERRHQEESALRAESLTDGAVLATDLTRVSFILEWLRAQGVSLPNLKRETIDKALNAAVPLTPAVRGVLEARYVRSKITADKLPTGIDLSDADGRLRDQFVYHGAHPGRWTGQGVQPHNLPKPRSDLLDCEHLLEHVDDYARFKEALPVGVSISDGITALIRPCFRAEPGKVLCIADFAGIEPRVLAWCAGEERLQSLFRNGGDPYCDLAGRIFGRAITRADSHERNVGKVAVIGCGYGMGAERFAVTCEDVDVDLAAVGLDAEEVVEAYRDSYPAIAGVREEGGWRGGLWKDIERAARRALGGFGRQKAGRFTFNFRDGTLLAGLPSGRICYYRDARLLPSSQGYSKGELAFTNPKGVISRTYGGKLAENLVQATSRDLLAGALVQCEREGLPVVMHVHDEIVIEVPESEAERALRRLLEIMSTPPAWAEGLPIEVEGYCSERYVKIPHPGAPQGRARNGVRLA